MALIAGQTLLPSGVPAWAQGTPWPLRPVRYVVPYAPGGPTDAVGRLVAQGLADLWQQPVVVDNRPGANANIGADFVAKSPADGYTLLQGTSSTHGSNPVLYARLPYDARRDFVPIVALVEGPVYLCVAANAPWKDLGEMLQHVQRHAGEVNFGTAGPGSPQHLAGELLRHRARLQLTAVHYRGAAPALAALQRGEIAFYFDSTGVAQERAGRVRVLAVSTQGRWPLAPEVPSLIEQGVPDFQMHGWFGLFAPTGTPAAVVERIQRDANRVLAQVEVSRQIEALGLRPVGGTAQDFTARLQSEAQYWGELVRTNRLQLD